MASAPCGSNKPETNHVCQGWANEFFQKTCLPSSGGFDLCTGGFAIRPYWV